MRVHRLIYILLLVSSIPMQAAPTTIEIQGSRRAGEGRRATFAAVIPDRPVRSGPDGYSPVVPSENGATLPIEWEEPVEYTWDFGDDSPTVMIADLGSVMHVYEANGTYTVRVEAHAGGELIGEGTHQIEIRNRTPWNLEIAARTIEPETQTFELTAHAEDVPSDHPLWFTWDFGDGETAGDEGLSLVRHQYLAEGTYEVKVTVTDDDGAETEEETTLVISGIRESTSPRRSSPEEQDQQEAIISGFDATLSGAVQSDFRGEMRPMAGLHLQPVRDGVCRFMFSAWDDAQLAYALGVLDLEGIPASGATFELDRPFIKFVLEPAAGPYEASKKLALGAAGALGLAARISSMTGGLSGIGDTTDKIGLDSRPRSQPREDVPTASTSPFGLEDMEGFEVASGKLMLTFIPGDRAKGELNVVMRNGSSDPPPGLETLSLSGSFALDLVAARSDGLIRYDGCEPKDLKIVDVSPEDGTMHEDSLRPPVSVEFSAAIDPDSLTAENVQLTYPGEPTGAPVVVPSKLLRGDDVVWLVPEEALFSGVHYTVRIRTGDEGVRSAGGATLNDENGSGWFDSSFATALDFQAAPGFPDAPLACNLFQTTRDAPLVPGKSAVARVRADWRRPWGVHPSGLVNEFDAELVLWDASGNELVSTRHQFVRSDLWEARGIETARAEHSAQIYGWRPDPAHGRYRVGLKVETLPGLHLYRYSTICPTQHWSYAPMLTVEYFALKIGEWHDDTVLQTAFPVIRRIIPESEEYALQVFPIAAIESSGTVRVLELPGEIEQKLTGAACSAGCVLEATQQWLREQSSADVVVAFAPREKAGGGSAGPELRDGQGVVITLADAETEFLPRYVYALVHELGHVLDLEHLPTVTGAERETLAATREGPEPLHYEGIEGFRLHRDGSAGWNKSSTEGNEQGPWLTPLMFPATIPADEAFIANHHYRVVQRLFEELKWSANVPNLSVPK